MQDEDQHIDLPDLIDEWQAERDRRPDQVHRDKEGAPRQAVGKGTDDRRNADIGDHLDGKRSSQHRTGILAREVIGEQPERHGCKPRADKRDNLRAEQMTIGAVGKD